MICVDLISAFRVFIFLRVRGFVVWLFGLSFPLVFVQVTFCTYGSSSLFSSISIHGLHACVVLYVPFLFHSGVHLVHPRAPLSSTRPSFIHTPSLHICYPGSPLLLLGYGRVLLPVPSRLARHLFLFTRAAAVPHCVIYYFPNP